MLGEEERALALPPAAPGGPAPAGGTSSRRALKASGPRRPGRRCKAGPEPAGPGATAGDLLLIDDQGVPYTVSEGSASGGPEGSGPKKAPHLCVVCLRAFPYLSDLERHSISHSELKPHECKACGKTFKRSSHLRRHCNIHAGLRPFRCPLCPRRFREAGELAHHHRVHSGERPYQCPVCRLRFTEANTLRRHAKRKHPEGLGAPLGPPDPGSEPPWDDEGIPATAGAEEQGEEEEAGGQEPA